MIFSKMKFRSKVLLLVLGSCFALGAPTGAIALKQFQVTYQNFGAYHREALRSGADDRMRSEVQTAVSMLQGISDRQQLGELSLEEAKHQGADLLRKLRFGKDGYFWADTSDGTNVVLLGKDAEGKNRMNAKDARGELFIQHIIRTGMQPGGGFSDYYFPRPGSDAPCAKRGYSLYFKPFDWVVGTGTYLDDLAAIAQKTAESDRQQMARSVYLIVGLTVVILAAISLVAVIMVRRLIEQIGTEPAELEQLATEVAAGNLTIRLSQGRSGIYEAMRCMVEQLREVMEQVNSSALRVSVAASGLDSTARHTTDGSLEAVAQAETVAVASAQVSCTSIDIAKNCHSAADSSERATLSARNGTQIVKEIVQGMNRIEAKVRSSAGFVASLGNRSEQIGEIVATIEDIADQTNLLALNAAIEAARAGEQGRGFAVVADEVRALAERTTKATHEIGTMITSIQQETAMAVRAIEEGVKEAELGAKGSARSGHALEEILKQIDEVTRQINQIAVAAEEQTASTSEIADNIQQISDRAKMSASNAQEISSASGKLSVLSTEMQGMAQRFAL